MKDIRDDESLLAVNILFLRIISYRLCNDLLLWEPLAPVPTASGSSMRSVGGMDQGLNDLSLWGASKYIMCKSSLLNGKLLPRLLLRY